MIKPKSRNFWSAKLGDRNTLILTLALAFGTACTTQAISNKPLATVARETPQLAQSSVKADVPVVLASRFKIKPEKRSTFIQLATAALKPTRTESGSISYSFYEESGVPNSFIYFEEWTSRADLAQHLKTDYTQRLLTQFPQMLDGQADIRIYDINRVTYTLDNVDSPR